MLILGCSIYCDPFCSHNKINLLKGNFTTRFLKRSCVRGCSRIVQQKKAVTFFPLAPLSVERSMLNCLSLLRTLLLVKSVIYCTPFTFPIANRYNQQSLSSPNPPTKYCSNIADNNDRSTMIDSVDTKNKQENKPKNSHGAYYFGKIPISSEQIFFESEHTFALVNLRPIVPGHVLLCSKRRNTVRLSTLSNEEYIDLWTSVRYVQKILESYYDVSSCNIAIQDGKDAGQSVPHVHVHILPRVKGDFERNDDVYDHLDNWHPLQKGNAVEQEKKSLNIDNRTDRTMDEMSKEASIYRELILSDKTK